ncbi:hypothetical protein ACHWQZ_G004006 [Mnemiopsis leidyi]
MAVEGFSIFLGFISILINVVTFFLLITFKKHRDDKGAYFDGLMSGAMAVYLSFYYMALNYPEGIPETEEDVGKRNLLACVVIVLPLVGFLIATLSYMCAASFWCFINTKYAVKSSKTKNRLSKVLYPTSDRYDRDSPRSVTFGEEPERRSKDRETFLRQTSNKITIVICIVTLSLPILYILINIFMSDSTKADIIHSEHKCWVGGHGGELMWCLLYVPTLLTVASTLACYLWCGFKTDKSAFMSARPEDPTLRCLQLRVILVLGSGLWWLIEIPALASSSPATVQYINGFINIPLSILALYIFTKQRPEILETWNKHFPIARKAKKEVELFWKYYIYRPVIQKVFKYKNKQKKGSTSSPEAGSTPTETPGTANPTLEIPPDEEAKRAHYYSPGNPHTEDYDAEFGEPNEYENEIVADEVKTSHEADYDMPSHPESINMSLPTYDNLGDDYRNHESPLYIDLPEEQRNNYTVTRL